MMNKQKTERGFFAFFKTRSGRQVVYYAAAVTTCGLFIGNFVPHTFGLKYYRNFVQCYQNGMEREVPEPVQQRVQQALNTLGVNSREQIFIKPFTVFGFDLFQAGTTKYRFGAALGIPVNYGYNDVSEIKRNDIRFRDQPIDWSSPNGKLLEQAIILNEDEQVFGLCKAILQLQTHRVLLNSIFPTVSFLMVYTIGHFLNLRLNLFARHISVRLVMYSILGLFGTGIWSFMKDFNQVSLDAETDKKLSTLGAPFVAAGVGYYDKHLKKNIALRNLLGGDVYTALGNENYLLRQKSMPLTARKTFFEEKLRELQEVPATAQ